MGAASGDKYHEPYICCAVCKTVGPLESMLWNKAQAAWEHADPKWCAKAAKRNEAVK